MIPKALVISNFKINLVYSAALLSSVGGLVAYIVEQRAYLTPLNLQTQLAISALPGKGSRPLCAPSPAGPCWYSLRDLQTVLFRFLHPQGSGRGGLLTGGSSDIPPDFNYSNMFCLPPKSVYSPATWGGVQV